VIDHSPQLSQTQHQKLNFALTTKPPKTAKMSVSSPLLNTNINPTTKAPSGPSPLAKTILSLMGFTRAAFGLTCLLVPTFALPLLGLTSPLSPAGSIITRMFGVREIIVGELLLLAERSASSKRGTAAQDSGDGEVKRAIWLNVGTDGLDILAVGLALGQGMLDWGTAGRLGGTAVLYAGMGVGLRWLYGK